MVCVRGRRTRHTRYRKAKVEEPTQQKEGLVTTIFAEPDSQCHHLGAASHARVCHITAISMELVKFDMQLMENAEISGVEYQQGTLAGYEVREYLLEKWGRKCTYCGKENIPLQIEHIDPTSQRWLRSNEQPLS